ncbi:MAG: NAD(P)H-dependent oxidoreductase [Ignavibacteria bacterium]|nr:NAD(P)H-dependent oxidoreductase [Ignavibacteria bacterium]
MLNITIVVGSVRTGRHSHKAAYFLEKKLNERKDVSVKVIDLIKYEIPILEERLGRTDNPPAAVKEAGAILDSADAIILVSPEYHGGMSGVLKNFLDYYLTEISGKPIGVVTASGGKLGGINASHEMQKLILAIGSYPMPKKFLVPFVHEAFDDEYNVLNDEIAKGAEMFTNEFLWFAHTIAHGKTLDCKAA